MSQGAVLVEPLNCTCRGSINFSLSRTYNVNGTTVVVADKEVTIGNEDASEPFFLNSFF